MIKQAFYIGIIGILTIMADRYIIKSLLQTFRNRFVQSRFFRTTFWMASLMLAAGAMAAVIFPFGVGTKSVALFCFFLAIACRLCLLPFLIINDLRKRSSTKKPQEQPVNEPAPVTPEHAISRSQFLVKAGLLATALPIAGTAFGIKSNAVYDYHVKRLKLYLPNLPKKFDGLRLAQLSDVHSGSFYNKKAVNGGIDLLLREKPDLIFFTGDLVNEISSEMRDYQDIFSRVKAPLGVYSCLGNHDYGDYHWFPTEQASAANFNAMLQTHKNMGWNLLRNESRRLKVDGEEIGILGVENWGLYGRFIRRGDLTPTVKNTDDVPVKLMLSHDPSYWRAKIVPECPHVDMVFSGHTHGMQMGVKFDNVQWSPIEYVYPEWSGLYREKQQQLYVNVGYGFLPNYGRLGILPEITIFELKAAADPTLKA